jgi:hypothetical protein
MNGTQESLCLQHDLSLLVEFLNRVADANIGHSPKQTENHGTSRRHVDALSIFGSSDVAPDISKWILAISR